MECASVVFLGSSSWRANASVYVAPARNIPSSSRDVFASLGSVILGGGASSVPMISSLWAGTVQPARLIQNIETRRGNACVIEVSRIVMVRVLGYANRIKHIFPQSMAVDVGLGWGN